MVNRTDEIMHMTEEERLHAAEEIEKLPFEGNIALFKLLLGDESFRVRKTALEALLKAHQSDKLTDLFIDIINAQDNAGLRTAGVEGLTRSGPKAVEKILNAIDAEQWELSKLLVDVLGDIGDTRAIELLIELTHSAQQNLSTAAVEALGKLGTEDTIPHLSELLEKREIYIVFSTLEALANLGRKGFKLPIKNIISLMDDPLLKKAVFDLLGSTHDPTVVSYLLDGVRDNKRSNRDSAAKSLLQLYNSVDADGKSYIQNAVMRSGIYESYIVGKMLSSVDRSVITAGIRIMGWSGIKSSIEVIFRYADDPDTADASVSALIDMGEPVRTDVVGLIVGNKSEAQIKAGLRYLSQLPDMKAPPPDGLSYLLNFEDSQDILVLLAHTLGKHIEEHSLKLLVKLMTSDNKDVDNAAVENFIKVGRHLTIPAADIIRGMIHSNDYLLRLSSARLIASFYREQMDADIKTLMNDSEASVRAAVISTIGTLKLNASLEDVQMALADESRDVRIEAIRAIFSIEPERFIDIIKWLIHDEDPWVRVEIVKHLKDSPQTSEAIGILKKYTDDEFPAVKLTALQTLMDISVDNCTDEIEKVLSSEDGDIVTEVIHMIGRTNSDTAYRILRSLDLSRNPGIKGRALSLLRKYDHSEDKR